MTTLHRSLTLISIVALIVLSPFVWQLMTNRLLAPFYAKYSNLAVYQSTGYVNKVDSLAREGRLVAEVQGGQRRFDGFRAQVIPRDFSMSDSLFLFASYLFGDLEKFNYNANSELFRLVPSSRRDSLNLAENQSRIVPDRFSHSEMILPSAWMGRLSYRPAKRNYITLQSGGREWIIQSKPINEMRRGNEWIRGGALADEEPYFDEFDFGGRHESKDAVQPVLSTRVIFRIESMPVADIAFLGPSNAVARFTLPSRLAGSLQVYLNGEQVLPDNSLERARGPQTEFPRRLDPGDQVLLRKLVRRGKGVKIDEAVMRVNYSNFGNLGDTIQGVHYSFPAATTRGIVRIESDTSDHFMAQANSLLNSYINQLISRGNTKASNTNVVISLDRDLHRQLSLLCSSHAKSVEHCDEVWAAMTVLDLQSGEVRALAETAPKDHEGANLNLTNHRVGSAFKPFLAMAAYAAEPNLANLRIRFGTNLISERDRFVKMKYGDSVKVLTMSMPSYYEVGVNDMVDLPHFLQRSCNTYAVALSMLTTICEPYLPGENADYLNRLPVFKRRIRSGDVDFSASMPGVHSIEDEMGSFLIIDEDQQYLALDKTPLARYLEKMFDVDAGYRTFGQKETDFWQDIEIWGSGGPSESTNEHDWLSRVSPEKCALGLDIAHSDYRRTFVSWILGEENNQWNNVKIAESAARIITGKRIRASIISSSATREFENLYDGLRDSPPPFLRDRFGVAWNLLRNSLSEPFDLQHGTAAMIGKRLESLREKGDLTDSCRWFGKTGTTGDEDYWIRGKHIFVKEGMIWLVIANGRQPASEGLVLVVSVKLLRSGLALPGNASTLAKEICADALPIVVPYLKEL